MNVTLTIFNSGLQIRRLPGGKAGISPLGAPVMFNGMSLIVSHAYNDAFPPLLNLLLILRLHIFFWMCSWDVLVVNPSSKIRNITVASKVDLMGSGLSTICLLAIAYALVKLWRVGKRSAGLPPGPRTLPIIGNLHLMPTFKPYKKFAEWGMTYGPIYSLMVGSNPLIMLQSQKIAKDLLDKRGSNYSSRPDLYVLSDLSSRGLRQVAMVCRARVWTEAIGILK